MKNFTHVSRDDLMWAKEEVRQIAKTIHASFGGFI
jgi:hypothetical protein